MGKLKARWCFTSLDGRVKPYCAEGIVDTGATTAVIPQAEAKRLGRRLSRHEDPPDPPKDAQGRTIPGGWYILGGAEAPSRGCKFSPLVVFGQRGRKTPLMGVIPLQEAGATLRLSTSGDAFLCDRAVVRESLGAALNQAREVRRQVQQIKRLMRRRRYGGRRRR